MSGLWDPSRIASQTSKTGITRGGWHAAARLRGLSVLEYLGKRASGQKHCRRCGEWLPESQYQIDRGRSDGLKTICRRCSTAVRKKTGRMRAMGPPPAPQRDGDVRQARRRVNVMVRTGRFPRPNSVACLDCGHEWSPGERRHEYDHYLGYGTGHHLDVQVVCSTCHHKRERERDARNRD
jgi:hypothetical protein